MQRYHRRHDELSALPMQHTTGQQFFSLKDAFLEQTDQIDHDLYI